MFKMEDCPNFQQYSFQRIEVFKNKTLGTGSYGAVCKAKCDELVCAAKLLYPVLFQMQPNDSKPGNEHRQPFRRFELECQFLSRINHPNIVQYLGTYHDSDSNSPVLLMELLDDSLTHFLESSSGPVPYHVQVNLCYDIAQALAFLHSNGIIHRDLSSNNVLLLGGRAKVTDFGMSRFADIAATHIATMTMCPGTPAFMPPEALNEPPSYTEKIDTFSLGALTVQILTREFPKPSDRYETRELVDPNFPDSKFEAKISIPEIARRHTHISLIDPNHPLLAIALNCLKDKETDRPSSQELCQSFGYLKETERYEESSQQSKDQIIMAKEEQVLAQQKLLDSKDDEIQKLRDTLEETSMEVIRSEERHQQASQIYQEAQNESAVKESQLCQMNRELRSNEQTIVEYQREITVAETKTKDLLEQLGTKNIQIAELRSQISAPPGSLKTVSNTAFRRNAYLPLIPDISTQKAEIHTALQQRLKKGDTWYLINVSWMMQWKKYVGYKQFKKSSVDPKTTNPGPLDNSDIFRDGCLRDHMVDELDYFLLPESAWNRLSYWYGLSAGSKIVARKVVECGLYRKHCKVEVYLLEFKLCVCSNLSGIVTKNFSLANTVATLELSLRETFNVESSVECRVWYRSTTHTYELLSKLDKTLEEAGLYNGQTIVLEKKNSDGSWPSGTTLSVNLH